MCIAQRKERGVEKQWALPQMNWMLEYVCYKFRKKSVDISRNLNSNFEISAAVEMIIFCCMNYSAFLNFSEFQKEMHPEMFSSERIASNSIESIEDIPEMFDGFCRKTFFRIDMIFDTAVLSKLPYELTMNEIFNDEFYS